MKHPGSTPATALRSAMPALPADVARVLLAGLRSSKPERKQGAIEACLAARAFAAGFARGADSERTGRRHVIGPHHEHWLRGYQAGQCASGPAAARYLRDQLLPSSATPDAIAISSAPSAAAPAPRPERARVTRAIRAQPSPQLTLLQRGSLMSSTPQLTIRRECAGRCGTSIAYTVDAGPFAPEIYCDGLVAYKGGHLCCACESIVEAALATRRTAIAAAAFIDRRDSTT